MKKSSRFIIAVSLLAAGWSVLADAPAVPAAGPELPAARREGAEAFSVGDYPAAEAAYRNLLDQARAAADSGREEEARRWREEAYNGLFSCALRQRDAAALEALLADFDRDDPAQARTPDSRRKFLSGELEMLRNHPAQAQKIFDELQSKGDALPRELYFQLLSEQARLKQGAGDYAGAAQLYGVLAQSAQEDYWYDLARCGRIYATIKSGDLAGGRELLAAAQAEELSAEQRARIDLLNLLQMLCESKFSEFELAYSKLPSAAPGEPDDLRCEVATLAAEHQQKEKQLAEAVKYWRDAFQSASNDELRRAAARRIINAEIALGEQEEALQVLHKYLELFPGQIGEAEMRLLEPRLTAQLKRPDEALAQYRKLIDDASFPPAEWRQAVKEAAQLYRAQGDPASTLQLLELLRERSTEAADRQEAEYLLGEYSFGVGDYAAAARWFTGLTATPGRYRMRSQYWAMRSKIELKQWEEAMRHADYLLTAEDAPADLRASASFYRGMLLERLGRTELAMTAYDRSASLYPKSAMAAPARFQAAELAWQLKYYDRAAEWFADAAAIAEKQSAEPAATGGESDPRRTPEELAELAADALYRAVQAACYAEQPDAMLADLEKLEKDYPESDYTAAALFWQVDYLRSARRTAQALDALQRMADFYAEKQPERLPEVWYDQARLLGEEGETNGALVLLMQLTERYPESALAPEAHFLTGDLLSGDGRFPEAKKEYQAALALRDSGDFGLAARGRVADCAFQLFSQTRHQAELDEALTAYRALAETASAPPDLRLESYAKLGRACEAAKDAPGALAAYDRLLYLAADEKAATGRIPAEPWVARGGYAAIRLCLNLNRPDTARKALALVRLLEKLNLTAGEDFAPLERAVRSKFQI